MWGDNWSSWFKHKLNQSGWLYISKWSKLQENWRQRKLWSTILYRKIRFKFRIDWYTNVHFKEILETISYVSSWTRSYLGCISISSYRWSSQRKPRFQLRHFTYDFSQKALQASTYVHEHRRTVGHTIGQNKGISLLV